VPLKLSKRTFDEAWGSIAATIEPACVENARLSLAHAIIARAAVRGLGDLSALRQQRSPHSETAGKG